MTHQPSGFSLPINQVIVPTPPTGFITFFVRDGNTVWVKYSDDTEERISVG